MDPCLLRCFQQQFYLLQSICFRLIYNNCKDIAAKLAYAEEMKANKAKELYNKMRNRYQMRCSRAPDNQKMRDDYNAWRKQAQMTLSKYQLGEISWEEFEKVIRSEL